MTGAKSHRPKPEHHNHNHNPSTNLDPHTPVRLHANGAPKPLLPLLRLRRLLARRPRLDLHPTASLIDLPTALLSNRGLRDRLRRERQQRGRLQLVLYLQGREICGGGYGLCGFAERDVCGIGGFPVSFGPVLFLSVVFRS